MSSYALRNNDKTAKSANKQINKAKETAAKTVNPPSMSLPRPPPNTRCNTDALTSKETQEAIVTTIQDEADQDLTVAATQVTASCGALFNSLSASADTIRNTGNSEQIISMSQMLLEAIKSPAAVAACTAGQICATTIAKKYDCDNNNVPSTSNEQTPTATLYKFTFKLKNMDEDRPLTDPIDELFNAIGDSEVQLLDSYESANGYVAVIQNESMFRIVQEKIFSHRTQEGLIMSDIFDIRDSIISAYSIKTERFDKKLLEQHKCLTNEPNNFSFDHQALVNVIFKYNRGWFKSIKDIEGVEVFGLTSKDNKASAKIHISHQSFKRFLASRKTSIMIHKKKLEVWEQFQVTQCLRCSKLDHTSDVCKDKPSCRFCGADSKGEDGHLSKNCSSRNNPICPNCSSQNEEGDWKHAATSFKCPILRRRANELRNQAKKEACKLHTYN